MQHTLLLQEQTDIRKDFQHSYYRHCQQDSCSVLRISSMSCLTLHHGQLQWVSDLCDIASFAAQKTHQIHQPWICGLGTMKPPKMSQKVYTPDDSTAETCMLGVSATVMRPQQVKKSRFRKTKRKYQKNLPAATRRLCQRQR